MGFIKRIASLWVKEKDPESPGHAEVATRPQPAKPKTVAAPAPKKESAPSRVAAPVQFHSDTAANGKNGTLPTSRSTETLSNSPSVTTPSLAIAPQAEIRVAA